MLRIRTTVNNENIFLDLYRNEPVLLSLSFAELQDITKKNSNFSKAFSLPGSKKNNKVFNFFYDLNAIPTDFNPNNKFDATLMWDGYEIMVGSIRLNGVTIADNEIIYQVTFYNQVGNLMANIGDKFLFDLDLSYLSHPYTPSVVLESNIDPDLFPITGDTNYSYQDGRTMWGLYNIGYDYISANTINSSSTPLVQFTPIQNTDGILSYNPTPGNFDFSGTPVRDYYFKPAIQAKELYEAIIREAGYQVESEFFETSYFKRFYMPLKFADDTIYPKNAIPPCYTYFNNNISLSGVGTTFITNPSINVQCNALGWTGTSTSLLIDEEYAGNYTFKFTFVIQPTLNDCDFFSGLYPYIEFRFNDGVLPQVLLYENFICDGTTTTISFEQNFVLSGSSSLQFSFFGQYININNFTFEVTQGPRFIPDGSIIDYNIEFPENDYTQIDFITSMNKYFNMIVVPNPDDPTKLIIEPIIDYIGKGRVLDWTTKIDFNQPQNLYPTSSLINGTLDYEFKLDQDYANKDFQGQSNRIFGTDKIKLKLPYKDTTTKFDYIFSSPIDITLSNAFVPIVTMNSMSKLKQIDISGQTEQTFVPFKILPKLTFRGLTLPVDNYGFVGGTGQTISPDCTSGVTLNVTKSGFIRYDTCTGNQVYQNFSVGTRVINGCIVPSTVDFGIPYTPLANFTIISSGTPCNILSNVSIYQYWYMNNVQQDRFTNINRFTTYPFNYNRFSHYINFRAEDQSNITPAEFSFVADDLYDIYYKPYIDDLISEENKIYAAKIYLLPQDIEALRWNERILINNTYFRINKITDFNALEPTICDIELVKLTKEYPEHPKLYYDFTPCSTGDTLHSNSDLMYNIYAYAGNYVELFDTELNYLGCYGVTIVPENNYTYEKYWISSAYTSNLVSVFDNCGCSGRTEFIVVQEEPTDERLFYYTALDCATSAITYTFSSLLSELSGGSSSVKIFNPTTTETVCVFNTQPTFIQTTPWSYLSAYTNCEECSFVEPTPTPTMTPTMTQTPSPTPIESECYILNSAPFGGCSIEYVNQFGTTITDNIPAEDEGLCFTICARSIISDSCGFSTVGVPCDDPQCDCNPPELTPTPTPSVTGTIATTPTQTPTPSETPSVFGFSCVTGLNQGEDYQGSGLYSIAFGATLSTGLTEDISVTVQIRVFEDGIEVAPITGTVTILSGNTFGQFDDTYQNLSGIDDTTFGAACIDSVSYSGPETLILINECGEPVSECPF
jgi:hypothetical protein